MADIDQPGERRAGFRAMTEGTAEDWAVIAGHFLPFAANVADRVLDHLRLLDGDYGGFPVDRLTHSLQTATRAHRDGRPRSRRRCWSQSTPSIADRTGAGAAAAAAAGAAAS